MTRAVTIVLWVLATCVCGCARTDPNTELGQDWMDALNSHDPTRIVELMQPLAPYKDPMAPDGVGATAYAQWLSANWVVWKDRVYIAQRMSTTSSVIVIEWRLQQTDPSGKSVPVDGATILDVAQQRISGVRNYYSTTAYLQFVKFG